MKTIFPLDETKEYLVDENSFDGKWKNVGENRIIIKNGTFMIMQQNKVIAYYKGNIINKSIDSDIFIDSDLDPNSIKTSSKGSYKLGFGVSAELTLAPGVGGTYERGTIYDENGKPERFTSYAVAGGAEFSFAANFFVVFSEGSIPRNFCGRSAAISGNFYGVGISVFADMAHGAGADGMGTDTYGEKLFGIKFSKGPGVGASVQTLWTKINFLNPLK